MAFECGREFLFIRQNEDSEWFCWSWYFLSLSLQWFVFMCECFNLIYAKSFVCWFELLQLFFFTTHVLFAVCLSVYFVWFVLIHSIITRIKSKATEIELYVECFVLISLSIYSFVSFFCICRSAALLN